MRPHNTDYRGRKDTLHREIRDDRRQRNADKKRRTIERHHERALKLVIESLLDDPQD